VASQWWREFKSSLLSTAILIGLGTVLPQPTSRAKVGGRQLAPWCTADHRSRAILRKVLNGNNGIETAVSLSAPPRVFDTGPDSHHLAFANTRPWPNKPPAAR
jgi:hypothetical protein